MIINKEVQMQVDLLDKITVAIAEIDKTGMITRKFRLKYIRETDAKMKFGVATETPGKFITALSDHVRIKQIGRVSYKEGIHYIELTISTSN